MGKTKPDYKYLDLKVGIKNAAGLRTTLVNYCEKLDMKALASDVEPFLFEPKEKIRVSEFAAFIASANLE